MIINPQKALKVAEIPAIKRIRNDHRRAPQKLKPLLAFIRDHLFDPELDVNYLKKRCGVRDNSVPIQFHSAVGKPPHRYIEDRRMETACRLLVRSDLKIWQIGQILGYSSIQVFSRAFTRWSGERPTVYRKKQRRRTSPSPLPEGDAEPTVETLRRGLRGALQMSEATALVERLLALYPEAAIPDAHAAQDLVLTEVDAEVDAEVAPPEVSPADVAPAEAAAT